MNKPAPAPAERCACGAPRRHIVDSPDAVRCRDCPEFCWYYKHYPCEDEHVFYAAPSPAERCVLTTPATWVGHWRDWHRVDHSCTDPRLALADTRPSPQPEAASEVLIGRMDDATFEGLDAGDPNDTVRAFAEARRARESEAALRAELRFYADPQTYGMNGGNSDRIMADHGKKAAAALKEKP